MEKSIGFRKRKSFADSVLRDNEMNQNKVEYQRSLQQVL